MKLKATKKEIRNGYKKVLCVGYCNLQHLLKYREAFAYSTRVEGWACDFYDIGFGVAISTGCSPTGDRVSYDLCKKYDSRAREIIAGGLPDASYIIDGLISQFRREAAGI